jgi:hypothetical protein
MDIRLIAGNDDRSEQPNHRLSYNNGNITGANQRTNFRNNNNYNTNQQNGNRTGVSRLRGGKTQQNGANKSGKNGSVTVEDLDAELEAYRAESAPKK